MPVRTRTLLAAVAACAVLLVASVQAQAATTLPSGFDEVALATGLSTPVDVTWAPDGRMFVASRAGVVYVHDPGDPANVNTTLLNISGHVNNGPSTDHGLLGIATDSDFATNHYLYLLYTYDNDTTDDNGRQVSTLTRVTVNDDDTVVGGTNTPTETTLLGSAHTVQSGSDGACGAPDNAVDCIPSEGTSHTIGTVRSAPDGTLFVGTGDGSDWTIVDPLSMNDDNPATYRGKIMHVDRNGNGVSGHPFCPSDPTLTDVCTKIYAEGFRNPFRFTLLPSGGLAIGDVGQGNWEEMDLASGGEDFGWPCFEGPGPDQFSAGGKSFGDYAACQAKYTNNQTTAPALSVAHHYPDCNASTPTGDTIVGGPVYEGDQYPAGYRGQIFFGDVGGGFFDASCGWIGRADISGNALTGYQPFATAVSQGVDLETDPVNGNLVYVSLLDGAVREIEYGPGNHRPDATPTATPASGRAPLGVSFDAGATDQDGDPLSYDWDFGDGSAHSTDAAPTHEYSAPGDYVASVTVDDGRGMSTIKTVPVHVTSASAGDPPAAPQQPAPAPPKPRVEPPVLTLSSTTARLTGRGVLRGNFSSARSVKTLRVSLWRGTASAATACGWWSSRTHGLRRGQCSRGHWMTARLHRKGSRYSWTLKLGATPKPGRYTVLLQASPRSNSVAPSERMRLVLRVRR